MHRKALQERRPLFVPIIRTLIKRKFSWRQVFGVLPRCRYWIRLVWLSIVIENTDLNLKITTGKVAPQSRTPPQNPRTPGEDSCLTSQARFFKKGWRSRTCHQRPWLKWAVSLRCTVLNCCVCWCVADSPRIQGHKDQCVKNCTKA